MKLPIFVQICILTTASLHTKSVCAEDSEFWKRLSHTATPSAEIEIARFDFLLPANHKPNALIVLCPGQNGDGSGFLEDEDWRNFARETGSGLVALTFKSPDAIINIQQGYFDARRESGAMLGEALGANGLSDVPLLVFGFSAGAQFANSYALTFPKHLLGWSGYSASHWLNPETKAKYPALIACGILDERFGASISHFQKGRSMGMPWAWLNLKETGHWRSGELEDFVRLWFKSLLERQAREVDQKGEGVYVHAYQKKSVSGPQPSQSPLYSWLPSPDLVEAFTATQK